MVTYPGSSNKLLSWFATPTTASTTGLSGKKLSLVESRLSIAVSANDSVLMVNGELFTGTALDTWPGNDKASLPSIGKRTNLSNVSNYLGGTISCIRIYNNKKLSQAEMEHNHAIDVKRFNLS
jgi:hypothetical protein